MQHTGQINGICLTLYYQKNQRYYYDLLQPTLKGMCHATSQDTFEGFCNKVVQMLKDRQSRNVSVEEEL